MADTMLPFRELLNPSNKFQCNDTLQQTFEKSKLTIINEIHNGVKIFDKTKPTCLATDWSKHGIGYWLFQKHCSCPSNDLFCCKQGWKITLVGSRFTHAAESRYAPIEGLVVADALDKARHFVLGCENLTIAVDHRPLLKIFGDRSLHHICNTRLRNLKEKTLRYHFKMVHIPGVKNRAPDTLSRHPTGDHHPPKMVLHDDIHSIQDNTAIPPPHIPTQLMAGICTDDQLHSIRTENQLQESLLSSLHSTHTVNWEQFQTATSSDDNMLLLSTIEDGIPEFKHQLPPPIREYHQFRRHLHSSDGIVIYKHQSSGLASQTTFKPPEPIAHTATGWPHHRRHYHPHLTPYRSTRFSAYVQTTSTTKSTHLVIIDRYSNWPIVERAKDGAQGLINVLRHTFATYGIPDELSSDGGPEFVAHTPGNFYTTGGYTTVLAL